MEPSVENASQAPDIEEDTKELAFEDKVLQVGKIEVTYREVLVYLLQIKNKYEPNLGAGIWKQTIENGQSFEEIAKEEILSQITKIKIMVSQANELEIQLESDELDEISISVNRYLDKITKEDQEKYGITKEIVEQVLQENYLAEKMFVITTNEVDTNISDEEAKQVKIEQLVIVTKGTDKNGMEIDLSEEEKVTALERMEVLRDKALTTEDFYSFAVSNSEVSEVSITTGKGDLPALDSVIFSLKEDNISQIVTTSYGDRKSVV